MEDHKETFKCKACKWMIMDKHPYGCLKCSVKFHAECAKLPQEVNYLCHSKHPLMLLWLESPLNDVGKTCVLCGRELNKEMFYNCSICNFSTCLFCITNPPRVAIEHLKTHEHQLFLMPSHITFTCNVCGMQGAQSPYLCLQCGFSVHRACVDLPRVININRHEHRVSFTHHLGSGYTSCTCNVCHKSIDQYYGGYACSVCPNYAVHSHCAVRKDVWEGVELESIPEEIEDIAPFIVVGDNLIKHFNHENHNLRFDSGTRHYDENTRCKACVRPVYSDPIYECEQCNFVLHIMCANLPRKKRLVYSRKPFTLTTDHMDIGNHFRCSSCEILSTGFRYVSDYLSLDIFCASFSEPLMHDGHLHPMYFTQTYVHKSKCSACLQKIYGNALYCDTCDYRLHFACANMPIRATSKFDKHPLVLCYGEKTSNTYWCDICEKATDPAKWFYTCSDCGVTLHVECVLGDFSHLMPGSIIKTNKMEDKYEVVCNNQNSRRPFCHTCKFRCRVPYILKTDDQYICSIACIPYFKDELTSALKLLRVTLADLTLTRESSKET